MDTTARHRAIFLKVAVLQQHEHLSTVGEKFTPVLSCDNRFLKYTYTGIRRHSFTQRMWGYLYNKARQTLMWWVGSCEIVALSVIFASVDIFIVDLIFFLSQLCFFKSEAVATDSTLAGIKSKSGRHAAWGHWMWASLLVCGVKVLLIWLISTCKISNDCCFHSRQSLTPLNKIYFFFFNFDPNIWKWTWEVSEPKKLTKYGNREFLIIEFIRGCEQWWWLSQQRCDWITAAIFRIHIVIW